MPLATWPVMKKSNPYNQSIYQEDDGWHYRIWKILGGGFTAKTFGGPYKTEQEAFKECMWKVNEWEREYED